MPGQPLVGVTRGLRAWVETIVAAIEGNPLHPIATAVDAESPARDTGGLPGALARGRPALLLRGWADAGEIDRLVSVARRAGGDACVASFDCELVTPNIYPFDDQLRSWMADHGRVRDAAAAFDDALLFAELEGRPLALRGGDADRVHLVVAGTGFLGGAGAGALIADDFLGVTPAAEANVGLAMRYDAPNARPPQSVLLAVHPDFSGQTPWTFETLQSLVHEVLVLSWLRVVEPEDLANSGADRPLPFALLRDGQAGVPDVGRDL